MGDADIETKAAGYLPIHNASIAWCTPNEMLILLTIYTQFKETHFSIHYNTLRKLQQSQS